MSIVINFLKSCLKPEHLQLIPNLYPLLFFLAIPINFQFYKKRNQLKYKTTFKNCVLEALKNRYTEANEKDD